MKKLTPFLRKEIVESVRFASAKSRMTMMHFAEKVIIDYLKKNKKKLDEKLELKKFPEKEEDYALGDEKQKLTFYLNHDDYFLLKASASFEKISVAQKVDEILGDYIDKNF